MLSTAHLLNDALYILYKKMDTISEHCHVLRIWKFHHKRQAPCPHVIVTCPFFSMLLLYANFVVDAKKVSPPCPCFCRTHVFDFILTSKSFFPWSPSSTCRCYVSLAIIKNHLCIYIFAHHMILIPRHIMHAYYLYLWPPPIDFRV
jgi:hypothetical protein